MPPMNKVSALTDLFKSLFSSDELHTFLGMNTSREIMSALPSQASLASLAFAAAGVLERRGEVTRELFAAMRNEFPNRTPDIANVEMAWFPGAVAPRQPLQARQPPPAAPPTFHWLDDDDLDAVHTAIVSAGLATQVPALVGGISPDYIGNVLTAGPPNAVLLGLLQSMNGVKNLADGTVPLGRVLRNAALLTRGQTQQPVINKALERIERGDTAEKSTAFNETPSSELANLRLEVVLSRTDQTLSALFLIQGAAAARSVGRVLVHRHFGGVPATLAGGAKDYGRGTGWLIAPDLVITNRHVIEARGEHETRASDEDFALQASRSEVQFDFFSADATPETHARLKLEAFDSTLDFAILRLARPLTRAPLRLCKTPLERSPRQPLRERVNLLQHPNGDPLRIGFRNNFVVRGDAKWLSYLTDTQGGSSGSPVCDDVWEVIALHRGYRVLEGGIVKLEGVQISYENYGTQVTAILEYLRMHNPALHREILAGQSKPPS